MGGKPAALLVIGRLITVAVSFMLSVPKLRLYSLP